MKSEDLLAILDFFYYGEAIIYQESLDRFLRIAEELQLKGLNGGEGESVEEIEMDKILPMQTYKPTG